MARNQTTKRPNSMPLPYWRLSGYYFFYFAFIGVFSPYFGLYLQSISFSPWEIGLLISQMQLMRLIGPYLWGWLSDWGYKRVVIVRFAGLTSLAGFMAFFWLDQLASMLIAMTILAFFWSAALPLTETLTFDHLKEQPEQYSRIRLWGSVGFIITVLGTGLLLDWVPVRGVLWVCALILAGIFAFSLLIPEAPPTKRTEQNVSVGNILRQPRVRALLAACFAMSAAHGAMYFFYSIHLVAHNYDKLEVGILWSLGVVAEILVFMFMSRLTQRFSLRQILVVSFAAAVLRFLLIGWGADSIILLVIGQLLHGLTFGAYHAAAITTVNQWFPGKSQARGQALYSSMSFGAGGFLGGLLSGWTWDKIGAGWTYTLSSLFALAGFILVYQWVHEDKKTS